MEKIDILLLSIGGGFACTWAIMFYLYTNHLKSDVTKLENESKDTNRRVCRLEGSILKNIWGD